MTAKEAGRASLGSRRGDFAANCPHKYKSSGLFARFFNGLDLWGQK
jgi:hypothetical protein